MRGRKLNGTSARWGFRRRRWRASKTPVGSGVTSAPTNLPAVTGQAGRPVATPRRFDLTLPGALNVLALIAGLTCLGIAVAYFAEVLPAWGGRSGATALGTGAAPLEVAKVGAQPAPGAASAAPAGKPQSCGPTTGAGPGATAPGGRPRGGATSPLAYAGSPLAPPRPCLAAQAAYAVQGLDLQARGCAAARELEPHNMGLAHFAPAASRAPSAFFGPGLGGAPIGDPSRPRPGSTRAEGAPHISHCAVVRDPRLDTPLPGTPRPDSTLLGDPRLGPSFLEGASRAEGAPRTPRGSAVSGPQLGATPLGGPGLDASFLEDASQAEGAPRGLVVSAPQLDSSCWLDSGFLEDAPHTPRGSVASAPQLDSSFRLDSSFLEDAS
jgi:hypothetical protein